MALSLSEKGGFGGSRLVAWGINGTYTVTGEGKVVIGDRLRVAGNEEGVVRMGEGD